MVGMGTTSFLEESFMKGFFSPSNSFIEVSLTPAKHHILKIHTSFFFFFPFEGRSFSIWKFPGQGVNRSCSCRPTPQPQQHGI